MWSATSTSPEAHVLIQHHSYDGVYSYLDERDGINYPIDTRCFTLLRFRMYASQPGDAVLWWYAARATTP